MIGRTNVGGGASLNFKVVGGTSAPSNPKENTIWVNTSTAITIWDFSATEPHRRSNNKNLIVYPYLWTQTGSQSGITYTVNGDGTISANGTASANAYCHVSNTGINKGEIILEAGTYTLSGCSDGGSNYALNIAYSYDNWATDLQKKVASGSITFTIDKPAKARFYININRGTKVSNLVFKPQLEKGSTATSFVKGDATGQVWFPVGTSSPVEFNALKKNGITVYPLSAKQYVSGAWVDKTAKSYQNDAWVDWWKGELYTAGDEWVSITGGWKGVGWAPDSSRPAIAPTVTRANNCLKVYMPSGHSGGVLTPAVDIDLTNFTTLTIRSKSDRTSGLWLHLGVIKRSTTYWYNNWVASVSLSDTTDVRTYTVDISALSGSYCVGVFINPGSYAVNFEMYELVLS